MIFGLIMTYLLFISTPFRCTDGTILQRSQPLRYSDNIITTQNVVAKDAAIQAKNILARKALEVAMAVDAALANKRSLVHELIKPVREAEISLTEQESRLQQARRCAETSYNNLIKRCHDIERLKYALTSARLALASAEKDAKLARERYENFATVIDAAREKYSNLMTEFKAAEADLEATKVAARRAEAAAEAAKANAIAADVNFAINELATSNTIDFKIKYSTASV